MAPGALSLVLWATDLDGFATFLTDVAGATLRTRHPGFAALTLDGSEIQLHSDESYPGHPWREALANEGAARGIGAEVRMRVEGVDARHRVAVEMGYISIQQPHDDGSARSCQIMGPDGYFFTLWEPPIGGS
ncbi:MAG: VOC family protein [Chloroflexi bacterium]|nr:VOC family protein [Chloroflexota bacterium]